MRSAIFTVATIFSLFLGACSIFQHGGSSPTHGVPSASPAPGPTPPAGPQRISLQDLRAKQAAVGNAIHSPYREVQMAVRVANGGQASIDGLGVGYWLSALPFYLFYNGQPDQAKAYFRAWLKCEAGKSACGYGNKPTWRDGSMVCSLNHQLARQFGIYAATMVLGPSEASQYGDPKKVAVAKQHLMDILTGAAWFDTEGNKNVGQCDGGASAGDQPEGWRSRHYASRFWNYVWAAADFGDPDVMKQAGLELDKAMAHMKPGVGDNSIWDETILPHFRDDTSTRCPQICTDVFSKYHITCAPQETPVISYLLFPGKQMWVGFGGESKQADCGPSERSFFFYEYLYMGGNNWRPLK